MQVQVAKTHLLEDMRRRATRLEPYLSNPASETAYRQVKQRIELLEKTPGDTVADVQENLRKTARNATIKMGGKLAVSAGLLAGLITLAGNPSPTFLQTMACFGCLGGAMAVGLWSVVEQVDREMALEGIKALDEEVASRSAPRTGNLLGAPTVSLGGEASVGQLRSLLEATRTVLAAEPDPEAVPARKLLDQDLKRLKGRPDESLAQVRQSIARREKLMGRIGTFTPWLFGGGMLVAGTGHPVLGFTIAALGLAGLPALLILDPKNLVETLDRWEPQLELFREAHQGASEWTLAGSGGNVAQGERSVTVGGVVVRLKPR